MKHMMRAMLYQLRSIRLLDNNKTILPRFLHMKLFTLAYPTKFSTDVTCLLGMLLMRSIAVTNNNRKMILSSQLRSTFSRQTGSKGPLLP